MQFNLVNDQEQVAQFVWRGVVWRSVALDGVRVRVYQYYGGCQALVHVVLSQGVFGQFQRSAASLHIRRAPAHVLVAFAWLTIWMWWRSCAFQYFPSLLSLFTGVGASPQQFFSIELTVQCDGCLIWGLGWRAGLVAWLWVWVVGFSPQILEHPTSICDTDVNKGMGPVSRKVPKLLGRISGDIILFVSSKRRCLKA